MGAFSSIAAQAAAAPEPNTPLVLGLDFVFGLVPAVAITSWALRRPVGILQRYLQFELALVFALSFVVAPVLIVTLARQPGQWPKALAAGAGWYIGLLAAIRHTSRANQAAPAVVLLKKWYRPIDYCAALFLYAVSAFAIAGAGASGASGELGNRATRLLAVFVVSQVSISLLYRIVRKSLSEDYGVARNSHYVLAGVPVLLSVPLYIVVGTPPTSPTFSVLLLVLAWRYTTLRPTGTLITLRTLKQRWSERS
jgi:hypothetical protein